MEASPAATEGASRAPRARRGAWLALAALLVLAGLVRARLADAPLERDEGEYAYAGQLLLAGVPPYAEVYNMKLPGIYACYAAILWLFGETPSGIHAGLALANALTTVALFLLARRWWGDWPAAGAAAAFALLSLGQPILGPWANAEHFVLLPAAWGLLALDVALARRSRGWLVLAGLALGAAFVVKQHGGAFALVGAAWVLLGAPGSERRGAAEGVPRGARRVAADLGLFALAALVPLVATVAWLAWAGVLDAFRYWTLEYARAYVTQQGWRGAFGTFVANGKPIFGAAPWVWALALAGVAAAVWRRATRARGVALALACAASLAAICPGWFFRQHYYLLLLPAAALAYGAGLAALARFPGLPGRTGAFAALALALVSLGDGVRRGWTPWVEWDGVTLTRQTYAYNPFAESLEVARLVREHCGEDERVLVLGSEPQICFYARRRSATGFVYMYPLMERHAHAAELRRRMMEEVDRRDPAVVVFVAVPGSWAAGPGERAEFEAWVTRTTARYRQVARVPVALDGLAGADEVARWPADRQPHVIVMARPP